RGLAAPSAGLFLLTVRSESQRLRGPGAKLVDQYPPPDRLDLTRLQIEKLKRTEGDSDQAIDFQSQRTEHLAHLAVLAFPQRDRHPDVAALHAIERGLDRAIADSPHLDTILQLVEIGLRDLSVSAHAVSPEPACRRQLEVSCQGAVRRQ